MPELTARRLKTEHLRKMKELVKDSGVAGGSIDDGITEENVTPVVKSLPRVDHSSSVQNWTNVFRITSMPLELQEGS